MFRLLLGVATVFFLFGVSSVSATTIWVDDGPDCGGNSPCYSTIQSAVNAAGDGDTIIVRDGAYQENVVVDKELALRSENGPANCVIQAANSDDAVFAAIGDYVSINGFTITEATDKFGVFVGGDHCNISDNVFNSNLLGIIIQFSKDCVLLNNNFSGFGIHVYGDEVDHYDHSVKSNIVNGEKAYYYYGIQDQVISDLSTSHLTVAGSTNITVEDCNVKSDGLRLAFIENSKISDNTVRSIARGIRLLNSTNTEVIHNDVEADVGGIELMDSSNNLVKRNKVNDSRIQGPTGQLPMGISLVSSEFNTVENNLIYNNTVGIGFLSSSNDNTITNNDASNNEYGIYLDSSNNNKIYLNNYINNDDSVYSYSSSNTWNSTHQISYTYNGNTNTNYLGNYWSDYTVSDTNGDGIGDSPHSIEGENDNYPLAQPIKNYHTNTGQETKPRASSPGFEVVFAIAGLITGIYIHRKLR